MKKILILLTATALTLTAQTFNVSTTAEFRTALQNAAGNGENDTILLADGTYTTTDDGKGTLFYTDDEMYDLTLIGSHSSNVILSGDNQNQILNFDSILETHLKIEKLTFMDGKELDSNGYPTNYGGGFRSENMSVEVSDCNFTNNQAIDGGGFYLDGNYHGATYDNTTVNNTTFTNNSAYMQSRGNFGGGGFYAERRVIVTDSNFTNNTAFNVSRSYSDYGVSDGGGFHIHYEGAIVNNSIFIGNSVDGNGGALYVGGNTEIRNSKFIENRAYSSDYENGNHTSSGGAIGTAYGYNNTSLVVENTLFHKNLAERGAGIFWGIAGRGKIKIIKSAFTENNVSDENPSHQQYTSGAAFVTTDTILQNSVIKDNYSVSNGSVIENFGDITIVNSIISNHDTHPEKSTIITDKLYMSNSILAHNGSGIRLATGTTDDPSLIINSTFVDANDSIIITASDYVDPVVKINNSYLDIDKVEIKKLISNNIFEDVTLGFTNEANGDYHLTATSDLIDAGTNDYADKFILDGVNYLERDYTDNNRSVGANMDIGIYEYTTSKPTIASFTHSEDPKTLNEITFDVEYVLSDGREISEISFDYLNDGTFSTDETHIYPEAKTYQVTVKVTDDTGEFSLRTIAVIVSDLPYDEMTDEQKLIKATDPLHYEDVLSIIEQEKVDAEDAGIVTGKTYVQDNLPEFGLLTEADRDAAVSEMNTTATLEGVTTGKEYVQNNLEEFGLIEKSTVEFTAASLATLPLGWSLVGVSLDMTDLSVFDDATIVWTYDNSTSSWGAYSSDAEMRQKINDSSTVKLINTIPAKNAIWIQK